MRPEKISFLSAHQFMPFTFKPETSPATDGQAAQAPVPSTFGNAQNVQPVMDLSIRTPQGGKSIVDLILIAAFGISILIAVGMFGYSYYLSSQIESKKATLKSYESSLGSLPLEDMRKLSNRMKIVSKLLAQHPSVNAAFKIIEDSVEDAITYDQFSIHYIDLTKSYELVLSGRSPDYRALAQQMDKLSQKPYSNYLQGLKLDSLTLDPKGFVRFSIKSGVAIIGLLPADLNLSDGVAAENSTTPEVSASSTPESTPQEASSQPQ
jgi:hypothetical protein